VPDSYHPREISTASAVGGLGTFGRGCGRGRKPHTPRHDLRRGPVDLGMTRRVPPQLPSRKTLRGQKSYGHPSVRPPASECCWPDGTGAVFHYQTQPRGLSPHSMPHPSRPAAASSTTIHALCPSDLTTARRRSADVSKLRRLVTQVHNFAGCVVPIAGLGGAPPLESMPYDPTTANRTIKRPPRRRTVRSLATLANFVWRARPPGRWW
jgi:hypothetical protein